MYQQFVDMRAIHIHHFKSEVVPADVIAFNRNFAGIFQNQASDGGIVGRFVKVVAAEVVEKIAGV